MFFTFENYSNIIIHLKYLINFDNIFQRITNFYGSRCWAPVKKRTVIKNIHYLFFKFLKSPKNEILTFRNIKKKKIKTRIISYGNPCWALFKIFCKIYVLNLFFYFWKLLEHYNLLKYLINFNDIFQRITYFYGGPCWTPVKKMLLKI